MKKKSIVWKNKVRDSRGVLGKVERNYCRGILDLRTGYPVRICNRLLGSGHSVALLQSARLVFVFFFFFFFRIICASLMHYPTHKVRNKVDFPMVE